MIIAQFALLGKKDMSSLNRECFNSPKMEEVIDQIKKDYGEDLVKVLKQMICSEEVRFDFVQLDNFLKETLGKERISKILKETSLVNKNDPQFEENILKDKIAIDTEHNVLNIDEAFKGSNFFKRRALKKKISETIK